MGYLSAMAGVLILDVLCEVGDLLVELEVGGLELGHAGHEALNPGLGLGERLRGRGGATALVRQLRLQLSHLDNDDDIKIETIIYYCIYRNEVLKRHVWICISFGYLTKKCRS